MIVEEPDLDVYTFAVAAEHRVRELQIRHAAAAEVHPTSSCRAVEVDGVIYPSARLASIETYIPEASIRDRANGRRAGKYVHPITRQLGQFNARWIGAKLYTRSEVSKQKDHH